MVALSALIKIILWQLNQYAQPADTRFMQEKSVRLVNVCLSKSKNHPSIKTRGGFFDCNINEYYIVEPVDIEVLQFLQVLLWVTASKTADKPTKI